jgi:hypothetical protein
MVIEHTFVTTMEPGDAMRTAADLLARRGFVSAAGSAFAVGSGEWNTLEMRRGKTRAAKAKNIAQLPQVAHVQWDRGRVSVVLSIEPSAVWGGGSFSIGFGLDMGASSGNPKKMKLHTELLMAIARALEGVLAQRQAPEAVLGEWDRVEAEIQRAAKRRFWRNTIILICFLLAIAALITTIALTVK